MRAAVIILVLGTLSGAVVAEEPELAFDLAFTEASPFGRHEDQGRAIARDNVDAAIVVGGSLGGAASTCGTPSHAFLSKRSREGQELWRRYASGPLGQELFTGISGLDSRWVVSSSVHGTTIEQATGNVFATGEMTVSWPVGSCRTLTTVGSFVVKLSPAGQILASHFLGARPAVVTLGSGSCVATCARAPSTQHEQIATRAIALGPEGQVAVAGWLRRATATGVADRDVFIAQLDTQLQLEWRSRLGSGVEDEGLGVAIDSHGEVFVTGYAGLRHDIFLAHYQAAGDGGQGILERVVTAGGNGVDEGRGLAIDSMDHLLVSGIITGKAYFGAPTVFASGVGREAFVAKYEPGLNLAWVRSVGGPEDEEAFGIAVGPHDDVFIVGTFNGRYINFRDKNEEAIWELQSESGGSLFLGMYNHEGMLCWATGAHGSADSDVAQGHAVAVVLPLLPNPKIGPDVAVTGRFRGALEFPSGLAADLTLANPDVSFDVLTAAMVGPAPYADDDSDSGFEHGRDIGKYRGNKPLSLSERESGDSGGGGYGG